MPGTPRTEPGLITVPRGPRSIIGTCVWPRIRTRASLSIPELVDRRRHRLVGGDVLGVAGGRAVVDLDRAVAKSSRRLAGKPPRNSQVSSRSSAALNPRSPKSCRRSMAHRSWLPRTQGILPRVDHGHDGVGLAAIADEVACADDPDPRPRSSRRRRAVSSARRSAWRSAMSPIRMELSRARVLLVSWVQVRVLTPGLHDPAPNLAQRPRQRGALGPASRRLILPQGSASGYA